MTAESIGVRLQGLSFTEQTIIICRIAEARSATGNLTAPELEGLFDSLSVPRPAKMNNILLSLERSGVLSKPKVSRGQYRLTPQGRARSVDLLDHMDLRALLAESNTTYGAELGRTTHPIVPASLAPPQLLNPIRAFLQDYPFDRNIFAMTPFPESDESVPDPVAVVLPVAREVCAQHGFTLHLASDRAIVDDLWGNVLAHMWASRYGLAIVEDRRGRGMKYNLPIEIGGMLTTGRRTALLKDASIARLPTDLVERSRRTLTSRILRPLENRSIAGYGTTLAAPRATVVLTRPRFPGNGSPVVNTGPTSCVLSANSATRLICSVAGQSLRIDRTPTFRVDVSQGFAICCASIHVPLTRL